jgi:hypothetical protein
VAGHGGIARRFAERDVKVLGEFHFLSFLAGLPPYNFGGKDRNFGECLFQVGMYGGLKKKAFLLGESYK